MVQWVKTPTVAAWVPVEEQVRSLPGHSGLKDLALLQLQHRTQLQLRFNPWPGTCVRHGCGHKKKKLKIKREREKTLLII